MCSRPPGDPAATCSLPAQPRGHQEAHRGTNRERIPGTDTRRPQSLHLRSIKSKGMKEAVERERDREREREEEEERREKVLFFLFFFGLLFAWTGKFLLKINAGKLTHHPLQKKNEIKPDVNGLIKCQRKPSVVDDFKSGPHSSSPPPSVSINMGGFSSYKLFTVLHL